MGLGVSGPYFIILPVCIPALVAPLVVFFCSAFLKSAMCLLLMLSIVIFDRRGMISTNWRQLQKMEPKSQKKGKKSKRTWTILKKKSIWSVYECF